MRCCLPWIPWRWMSWDWNYLKNCAATWLAVARQSRSDADAYSDQRKDGPGRRRARAIDVVSIEV